VDKGKRIHTIVAVVSMNVDQTIIGWKDLMAMGVISPDWPAMPQQEAEGRILAADEDEEEKELAPHTLRGSARVQERKERQNHPPTVNAIFQTPTPTPTRDEEQEKKEKKTTDKGREEEREGQKMLPTGSTGQHRLRSLDSTKLLSGQVQPAGPMGLPQLRTGQFAFSLQQKKNQTFQIILPEGTMIITIQSLIAAGIATAVVTGGITGTAVYLTAGNADVVTGNQIKTEGGLHILELGHMEPWAIAMMCATVLIGMGTCGACCHRKGKSYLRDKEAKLRDRALGRAKELVHMKAHGAEKLLEDVQTYHDMHEEIVVQKMHQVTPPRSDGAFADKSCGNPQCRNCRQPRHNTVGFCSATQTAKIIKNDAAEGNFADPLHNKEADAKRSEQSAERNEQSERASMLSSPMSSRTPSPPRNIAARMPLPPTVIEAKNDPFTSNADPLQIHMMSCQIDDDAEAEEALKH
jgi:hypothetical protein